MQKKVTISDPEHQKQFSSIYNSNYGDKIRSTKNWISHKRKIALQSEYFYYYRLIKGMIGMMNEERLMRVQKNGATRASHHFHPNSNAPDSSLVVPYKTEKA